MKNRIAVALFVLVPILALIPGYAPAQESSESVRKIVTRVAPQLCMRLNIPWERMYETRAALPSFLAHGYIGRYRKPAG